MKIGLYGPFNLAWRDGNSIRLLLQAEGLLKNGFKDFEIFAYGVNPGLGVGQHIVGRHFFPKKFPYMQRLPSLPVDLTHAHHYHGAMVVRGPIVLDMPSFPTLQTEETYKYVGTPFKRFMMRKVFNPLVQSGLEEKMIRRAKHVVVASENIKRHILDAIPDVKTPITVVTNSLRMEDYEINAFDRLRVGVSSSNFMDTIDVTCLDYTAKIAAELPDVEFYVAGLMSDKQRNAISALKNVKALGSLDFAGYKEFIKSISVFLMPYGLYYDYGGSKFKLLEAGACALAVVTTDFGAIGFEPKSSLLIGNSVGEIAAKIESLRDFKKRRDAGMALRREIETRHDYVKESAKLIEIYKEALS